MNSLSAHLTPPGKAPNEFLPIQYRHVITAILVVYFCIKVYMPNPDGGLGRQIGYVGADIFFAISGFIMIVMTSRPRAACGCVSSVMRAIRSTFCRRSASSRSAASPTKARLPVEHPVIGGLGIVVAVVTAIGASALIHCWFECPLLRWSNRATRTAPPGQANLRQA